VSGSARAPGGGSRSARRAAVLLAPRQGLQPLRDGARRFGARARHPRDEREPPVAHGGCRMSAPAWVAVGTLAVVVVWLGLALVGAVRDLGTLRGRVDALEAATAPTTPVGTGLAVGAPAPAWTIATPGGGLASSSAFEGRRHLLVFADATCRACDDLVPAVIAAASRGTVPPLAVIGSGDAASTHRPWRAADVRGRT